jgi:hypothetical protein
MVGTANSGTDVMTDLAKLGFRVDTSGLKQGEAALD